MVSSETQRPPPQVVPAVPTRAGMTSRTLWAFFALAFGIGWGVAIVLLLFTDRIEAIFGPIGNTNPVFVLIVYSPAIAGIALVLRHFGLRGLGSYLRRLTLVRMPAVWWIFLIVGIPAVKFVGAAINGTIGDVSFSPWYTIFGALLGALLVGPIEEFGWRGVALPLLQRRFAPLWASLILGGFWGLWHLPAFLSGDTPQAAWSLGPFLIGVLALSVLLTPMFNAARGSILIACLFHFQMNNPIWPDAQPWENYLFAAAAIVVVVLNRKTMFARQGAVTNVLTAGDEADQRRGDATAGAV